MEAAAGPLQQEPYSMDMPTNGDGWEDWLRWDPTLEPLGSEGSSKDSSDSPLYDGSIKDGAFPWMPLDDTLAPPFVIDDSSIFDPTTVNFAAGGSTVDPYIFGANNAVHPTLDHPHADIVPTMKDGAAWTQPDTMTLAQSDGLLKPQSTQENVPRRTSDSTAPSESGASSRPSPDTFSRGHSSATSPSPQPAVPQKKKAGRKRKSEMIVAEGGSGPDGEPPVKKTSHNVIEKRYRNNLNDKILELRDSVPSLRAMSKPNGDEDNSEDLEGLAPAHKLNKSNIMAKATEYIRHLEKRNKSISDEMAALKARMVTLEQAHARTSAMSDQIKLEPVTTRSRQSSIHFNGFSGLSSPVLAPSESHVRHRNTVAQASIITADNALDDTELEVAKRQRKGRSAGAAGKLMVASMATLMVMEGISEHNQQADGASGQALFAAPLHLLKRGAMSDSSPSLLMLPVLRLSLIFTALLYLILPLLKRQPPKSHKLTPHITLTAAPSLSSPLEIRRKAWLTAIQSVWTPKHFLLEVVAVTVRIAGMSLRRMVGFDRYAVLFGMSRDDEAARIKAWDIAIDAQLAGGDAEVSYYRLLLTLMASGTLPDSPIRLMQKAVHFRIFFWEVANAGYGNLLFFKDFTARVAKIYWDSARAQQRALASGQAAAFDEVNQPIEQLPEHLAALIELECDEVLTDDMIQRAYNLAWNRPHAENTLANAILDSVVEDPAVRSPLDAVAAWFTNTVVDEALALAAHCDTNRSKDVEYLVKLAASTAPPASSTLTRAYVAKAVLIDEDREQNIAAALESIPHATGAAHRLGVSSATVHLDVVNHVPLTAEVRTALTMAKLLSFCNAANPSASHAHAAVVLASMPATSINFTLLTAIASYKILDSFASNPLLFSHAKTGLEALAVSLRLWVGTRAGKAAGLQREEKGCIADRCLAVTKKIGGWREADEGDSGYGSSLSRRASDDTLVL